MPIFKDYFRCLSISKLNKKNQEQYLHLRLMNKDGIFSGYLWDLLDHYENRIKPEKVYAVKFAEEFYLKEKILKIKNIKSIEGENFDKYGYNDSLVTLSQQKRSEHYLQEIVQFSQRYDSDLMPQIIFWLKENKKLLLNSGYLGVKLLCLENLSILDKKFNSKIDFNLSFMIILLQKVKVYESLDLFNFRTNCNEGIKLYINDKKGFIKKYKYIVDLIDYNFTNYKNLTTGRDIK